GIVTLTGPAADGGVGVQLTTDAGAARPESPVRVGPGRRTAEFKVRTSPVLKDTPVSITATLGDKSASDTLTVRVPKLVSVKLDHKVVVGGEPAKGMVTLDGRAPTGGAVIEIFSDNRKVASPEKPTTVIKDGASTALFTVKTYDLKGPRSVTVRITASYKGE